MRKAWHDSVLLIGLKANNTLENLLENFHQHVKYWTQSKTVSSFKMRSPVTVFIPFEDLDCRIDCE